MVLGHKYFSKSRYGAQHKIFSIEKCENCGCECEASNSVGSPDSKVHLLRLGLIYRELPFDELMYCEALEMATCGDCYVEED